MAKNSIRFVHSISAIGKPTWQSLLQTDYPFLRFEFLAALEQSQCVDSINSHSETGWLPYYAVLETATEGEILAIAPVFKKLHSYGEYVFDWAWAEAYQQHGFNYYPKLIWAIPFTPATGPRIVSSGHSTELVKYYQQIATGLTDHCLEKNYSSWHCLFTDVKANHALQQESILPRTSCQFHWFNHKGDGQAFDDFNDYLQTFTSRKRKNINKERRRLTDAGFRLSRKLGHEISDTDIENFYYCYQLTYAKRNMHGYLTLDFFRQLVNTMPEQLMLVQARLTSEQDESMNSGQALASALYFYDQGTLYGRYWGCLQEYDSLHFECCYYQGIEFCIENKLEHFDPGTQGEHKISRGFQPTLCHSQHWIAHQDFRQAIKGFLNQESKQIKTYSIQANRHLPFKHKN